MNSSKTDDTSSVRNGRKSERGIGISSTAIICNENKSRLVCQNLMRRSMKKIDVSDRKWGLVLAHGQPPAEQSWPAGEPTASPSPPRYPLWAVVGVENCFKVFFWPLLQTIENTLGLNDFQ